MRLTSFTSQRAPFPSIIRQHLDEGELPRDLYTVGLHAAIAPRGASGAEREPFAAIHYLRCQWRVARRGFRAGGAD